GGEGFLYACAPDNSQWSVVASMQNRDVDSIVYHASQDALYALEVYRANTFGPPLYRFSATGAYQSQIQLPALPFDVGVANYQSELVSVGDYLFLLIGPDPLFPYNTGPLEERMYLIDPRSSQIWLSYRQVIPPAVAPAITQQPASQTVWAGQSVTFSAVATGTPLPDYQWQFNGAPIPGGTTPNLTLNEVQVTNAGAYTVVVSNPAGSVTSQPATLKVLSCVLRPAPGGQEKPAVASNGSLYLVVWADARGTNGWDIYATRVTPQGRVLDPDGIPICTLPQMQGDPAVASDGRDFLVAWNDARSDNVSTSYDIYGARVTAEGRVLEPNGFPICRAPAAQFYPSIAFNGTNYLLAWYDYRSSDSQGVRNDIYGARVSPQGVVLDSNSLAICTADDMQWAPGVASWSGEFFVAWDDSRRGLYGARVNEAGTVLPPNGTRISPNFSGYPIRVAANPTGYLVVWTDGRDYPNSGNNIYGRRLDFAGNPLDTNDLNICIAPNVQVGPAVTAWGNDFLAVWLDDRNGPTNSLVCATRIGTTGVLDPAGIPVGRSVSSSSLNLPAAASLNGQYLVVWVGGPANTYGATDICAARLRADGTLLDTNSLLISTIALEVPVLTWPAPSPMTYGTRLGSQQLNATTTVAGRFVYTPPAGTLLGVGAGQVLSVTFTPADTAHYT
ncbi:MAG TPA: immunoglobulin domain-containing protein, partial [Bacillota bacterium]|nr:immunoglobulin domain-containing protein [Bacillota bacterium]